MTDPLTVPVWTDDDGCFVVATSDQPPASPALPHLHAIDPDLLLEADVLDPARFVRLTATLGDDSLTGGEGDGGDRRRLVERLLGVAIEDGATSVEVDAARWALLGRFAAVGSSWEDAQRDGRPALWWAIESHAIAAELACPEVALGDPSDLLDAATASRWIDLGGRRDAAIAALAVVAAEAGRAAPTIDIAPGPPGGDPDLHAVEIGVLPTLTPGTAVQVPISGADATPGVFELGEGATVALSADGRHLEVAVAVADGAYLQMARAHRVQLQRLDVDLIVGEAALESVDPSRVSAEIRVSRHTRTRPLALRLFPQQQATDPNRQLVAAQAADSHALTGAALARLGRRAAAEAAFERAADWWRSVDQDEPAAASSGAADLAATVAPMLGEALTAAGHSRPPGESDPGAGPR